MEHRRHGLTGFVNKVKSKIKLAIILNELKHLFWDMLFFEVNYVNGNTEMLNYIYQNSQMGVTTIKQLLDISGDEEFKKQLELQHKGYLEIHQAAKEMLHKNGLDEKGISKLDRIKTYLMINMDTMMDKSSSHIAEMLIVGSNMGVINAVKNLKKYNEAEEDIKGLMDKLLKFEENNVQRLKEYLA